MITISFVLYVRPGYTNNVVYFIMRGNFFHVYPVHGSMACLEDKQTKQETKLNIVQSKR